MTITQIIILFIFVFGASFIQRVTGFGFGIFIMTVLPFIMPSFGEATALSGLLALVSASYVSITMRKYLDWKKLVPILAAFLVVSFFAVKMMAGMGDNSMKKILGCALIAVSVYFFIFSERTHIRPTVPIQLGLGTLSGMMGGLFAMQGPPAVIYFLSSTDDKNEYIALTQWYFFIGNLAMTFFRASSGFVTKNVGICWAIGVWAILLGLWSGAKVFDKMPVNVMRKCVYAFMAVAGVIALFS